MTLLICLLIGILTAIIGSVMGLGGGIVLIPSLIYMGSISDAFSWVTPQTVVGISLVTMVFTGLSSTLSYAKAGRVDFKTGILLLIGSIPGGIIGSWINQYVDSKSFQLYFGILMIVISLLFFLKKDESKRKRSGNPKRLRTFELNGETYQYSVPISGAILLSLVIGIISGLFGIGGGTIMVPAMVLLFGIPIHIAAATSMFMIFFTSLSGAGTHVALGHVPWLYALFFIPGAWIGGRIGAFINQKVSGKTLEWILRILLIITGLDMIFN